MGDIGQHFPDTDERWRGADSIELLRAVVAMLAERDLGPVNVDCTVIIEAPALAPHRERIRGRLADALGLDSARVNVKATTSERMGFVGSGEGCRRAGGGHGRAPPDSPGRAGRRAGAGERRDRDPRHAQRGTAGR